MTERHVFTVTRDELRRELAADLGRGGYVFVRDAAGPGGARYFDKYLVLSRPGLLTRSARLMADLVPADCERIAVTGVAAGSLATALSQETGVPLLLGLDRSGDRLDFGGERFSRVRVTLLEDVVQTGRRALAGVHALEAIGASVLSVLCLLDRDAGATSRLADAGYSLKALFSEPELLAHVHDRAAV